MDILSRILKRVGGLGLIEGICSRKKFSDILILQFAGDILLFCAAKMEGILIAKMIFLTFEGATGLKINIYKSSLICLNLDA